MAESPQGWTGDAHRIRGRRLMTLRAQLFELEPVCRACAERLATVRDHIRPLFEGGTEDPANIQPLCQTCSDTKTQTESTRGRFNARRKR